MCPISSRCTPSPQEKGGSFSLCEGLAQGFVCVPLRAFFPPLSAVQINSTRRNDQVGMFELKTFVYIPRTQWGTSESIDAQQS